MKATELRIGNYVYADLISGKGRTVIHKIKLRDLVNIEECGGFLEFKPIPLTPEILEKCGFIKESEYIFTHESEIVFDAPSDWSDLDEYPIGIDCSRSVMGYNPEVVIIRCIYLHDLQNKFYAIKGEELEINTEEL